jgi:DNA topoisomerase-1
VNAFLTNHFGHYIDYEFTARLEDELDAISRGEKEWIPVLDEFWQPFQEQVQEKEASVSRQEANRARELGVDPKSGKPVFVRMGRYGPYVSIGSPDSDEKPAFFGLKPGQRLDTITLEEALALTILPRDLGKTPDGRPLLVNIGRFGPYVKCGERYVSLPKGEDPYAIQAARAIEIVAEKEKADAAKHIRSFDELGIRVLNGRYGPYVTDGTHNARVPKDRAPEDLSAEDCKALLAAAAANPKRRRARTKTQ